MKTNIEKHEISTNPQLINRHLHGNIFLTTLSTMAEKAVKPYWQDVQVVEVNKEYPRTSFMTYNNRADALSGKFERSKYYRLLNGTLEILPCRLL